MKWSVLALALVLAPLACAHAETVQVQHAQGEVTFDAPPQRVAVFDLAILDDLAALEVPVTGVPTGKLPDTTTAVVAGDAPRIGTLFEPDLDAVKALQPDVIYIGGRSARAHDALEAIAPTLDLGTRSSGFFDSVTASIERLGRIHHKQDLAAQRIAELTERREALAARTRGKTALVLFTINGRVMPHAPGARFGIFHDLFGFGAVLPVDTGTSGPRPEAGSPEAKALAAQQARTLADALAAEPDWLIVLDRGIALGNGEPTDLSTHADITATRAWKAGHVFELDAPSWYRVGGGWHVIRDTLDEFNARFAEN